MKEARVGIKISTQKLIQCFSEFHTFHMFVSRSTSCFPDISIASTLKTASKIQKEKGNE